MDRVHFGIDDSSTADESKLWPLYQSIFGDYPTFEAWREAVWDRHRTRPGFRLARAHDHDALVGLPYGYTGAPGQWWTDNARKALPPDVADAWLGDHFERVSLGATEAARSSGISRGLLRALTDGLPHDRLLLMATSDVSDPARRLYTSEGWQVIGAGIGPETVIMGKQTPR
jgi:GNAT superfamily N-acetyltransferase